MGTGTWMNLEVPEAPSAWREAVSQGAAQSSREPGPAASKAAEVLRNFLIALAGVAPPGHNQISLEDMASRRGYCSHVANLRSMDQTEQGGEPVLRTRYKGAWGATRLGIKDIWASQQRWMPKPRRQPFP